LNGQYDGGPDLPLRFEVDVVDFDSQLLRAALGTPLRSDAVRVIAVLVAEALANLFKHSERQRGDSWLSLALRIRATHHRLAIIFENNAPKEDCSRLKGLLGTEFCEDNRTLARDLFQRNGLGSLLGNFSMLLQVTAGTGCFQIKVDESRVSTKYFISLEQLRAVKRN